MEEVKIPEDVMLDVRELKKYFPVKRGFFRRTVGYIKAVDGVNLYIKENETLGLAGESGCGKTTVGRCIIRFIEPTEGETIFRSKVLSDNDEPVEVELTKLSSDKMRILRQEMAFIFQDPISSLNPRMRVGDIIKEPLEIHNKGGKKEQNKRASVLLEAVGLGAEDMIRYPHEFSGGQRQRIGIARALALNPKFIVCDEPTSALDVSIQGQILNLLKNLQDQFGLTYFFISHDLSVIQHISDRVAIMYLGRIVELGETNELYKSPLHPYTEVLLSAVPVPDPDYQAERIILKGEVPSPRNPPPGCYFHSRCQYAEQVCSKIPPSLREVRPGHFVACHLAEKFSLRGIEV